MIRLFFLLLIIQACQKPLPTDLGLIEKNNVIVLKDCDIDKCVSSFKNKPTGPYFSEPIKVISGKDKAKEKVTKIVAKYLKSKVIKKTSDYLHIEISSSFFGLGPAMDGEFIFSDTEVNFRLSPRGNFLGGKGRKVIEDIRFRFHQNDY